MHWPIAQAALRRLVPSRLALDLHGGTAWIAVTPFTMWDVRVSFTPPLPWLSAFHELNVRTYVHLDGVPGVWFFSLDASSLSAVLAARTLYKLPYFHARIDLEKEGPRVDYALARIGQPRAEFRAAWTVGESLPESTPGSLAFFLTERYCLYAASGTDLYRARIHHAPWPLRRAQLALLRSTMVESHGLPAPSGEPLLHYAEALAVEIWPPSRV